MFNRILLTILIITIIPLTSSANLLKDPGFENLDLGDTYSGMPIDYGVWGYDAAEIVGSQNNISPYEGIQMLKFTYSNSVGTPSVSTGSDIYQYIDLTSYQEEINSGEFNLTANAFFNRIEESLEPNNPQVDTEFRIYLYAFNGVLSGGFDPIGFACNTLFSDNEASTWEDLTVEFILPVNTTYVGLRISAIENIFNNTTGIEFNGHFADNISVDIAAPVPEPGTLLLLGTGMLGLIGFRKRLRKS